MPLPKRIKVVVTGGAGFIGSHLVDACVSKGWDVHVIDIVKHPVFNNRRARYHRADIRNLKKILPIIKGAKYVFHLAAMPRVQYSIEKPDITTDVNVIGTMNVLIASKRGGVKRVIYSSSSSVYGSHKTLAFVEGMYENPLSPYALQKLVGELYCRTWSNVYGIETVSLRYFNVYGLRMTPKGSYPLAIAIFLDQRKRRKPITITGDGRQTRDFTHVHDVVRANLLAAKSNKVGTGEVINIGHGKAVSMNKIASLIDGPTVNIKPRLEPRHTLANRKLANKLLGWKPTIAIEEGIAELKRIHRL